MQNIKNAKAFRLVYGPKKKMLKTEEWNAWIRRSATLLVFSLVGSESLAGTSVTIQNCESSSRSVEVAAFDHFIGSATSAIKATIEPNKSTVAHCGTDECTLVLITGDSVVKQTTSGPGIFLFVDKAQLIHVDHTASVCK